MDLFGTHRISVDAIRRLAVECHALDVSAVRLLIDTTLNTPERVRNTYEELFSEKLLSLAVALRTKFYQGVPSKGSERFVQHSAFLLVTEKEAIKYFANTAWLRAHVHSAAWSPSAKLNKFSLYKTAFYSDCGEWCER